VIFVDNKEIVELFENAKGLGIFSRLNDFAMAG